MLCTVCSTLIIVKSMLDDSMNVKVVIFRNFFARRYQNMTGAIYFFLIFIFLFFIFFKFVLVFFFDKKGRSGRGNTATRCLTGEWIRPARVRTRRALTEHVEVEVPPQFARLVGRDAGVARRVGDARVRQLQLAAVGEETHAAVRHEGRLVDEPADAGRGRALHRTLEDHRPAEHHLRVRHQVRLVDGRRNWGAKTTEAWIQLEARRQLRRDYNWGMNTTEAWIQLRRDYNLRREYNWGVNTTEAWIQLEARLQLRHEHNWGVNTTWGANTTEARLQLRHEHNWGVNTTWGANTTEAWLQLRRDYNWGVNTTETWRRASRYERREDVTVELRPQRRPQCADVTGVMSLHFGVAPVTSHTILNLHTRTVYHRSLSCHSPPRSYLILRHKPTDYANVNYPLQSMCFCILDTSYYAHREKFSKDKLNKFDRMKSDNFRSTPQSLVS